MSLRDLIVSIDFDDIDIKKLLKVDDAMDEMEDQLKSMGGDIDDLGKDYKKFGSKAGDAMDEIGGDTRKTTDAINELGDDAEDVFDDLRDDARRSGGAIDQMSDDAGDAMRDMRRDASRSGDAFDALGSEARQAGNDATRAMDDAGDAADDAGDRAADASGGFDKFKSVGVGAAAAVATAISGVTLAVGLFYSEMDGAMDRLEAQTGATGAELEGLENIAENVFVGAFGENIRQVTDDVATLDAMFADLNDSQLQALAEGAYTIADLWDSDVREVGGVVKNLTANFKDLSEQQALDLITTGFQETGDYSNDLMDTLREYSPLMAKMGMDGKDFMNTLIKGAKAGAWNMDKIGDSMKEFGIRSIDGSDASQEAFEALGFNAEEMATKIAAGGDTAKNAFAATVTALSQMDDKVAMGQTGVALFGTQWEDLREDVIFAMADGTDAVGDFEGATQKAGDAAYDNFGTRMTGVFRDLKIKMADAFADNGGEELLDSLADKAEELIPVVENLVGKAIDFANAVKDNWPAIKETTITLGAAVGSFAAIMGGLKIIGIINTLMIAYRAGTVGATLAQWGLNTAMLANPLTWIVAGIAALIGIGVLLVRNWDTVTAAMGKLWSYLGEAWDGLLEKAGSVWEGIKGFFVGGANAVIDAMNSMIKGVNNIGFDVPDWVPVIGGKEYSLNIPLIPSIGGSHMDGLESVPLDGYIAELHKGEAVLTADQSNALRDADMLKSNGGGKPVLNLNQEPNPMPTLSNIVDLPEIQPEIINHFNPIIQPSIQNNVAAPEETQIAPSRSESRTNNTFAPNVTIQVERGENGQVDEETIAQAVKREMEKFWIQMQLQDA